MKVTPRQALEECRDDLFDALDEEGYDEDERWEMVSGVFDRVQRILDRGDLEPELTETVNRGARAKVKMSRGDGPRDQDTWTLEGEGRDHEEAAAELDALLEKYADEWADEARSLDPYADG
jgi:hypothetical protein